MIIFFWLIFMFEIPGELGCYITLLQTYPGIIQAYSGIFRTICYYNMFKTVAYTEPWRIQIQKSIQNPGIFITLLYSEPRYIRKARIFKIWGIIRTLSHIDDEAWIIFTTITFFTSYNCFRKGYHFEINILR